MTARGRGEASPALRKWYKLAQASWFRAGPGGQCRPDRDVLRTGTYRRGGTDHRLLRAHDDRLRTGPRLYSVGRRLLPAGRQAAFPLRSLASKTSLLELGHAFGDSLLS